MHTLQPSVGQTYNLVSIRATGATLLHDNQFTLEWQWGPVSEARSKFRCGVSPTGLILESHSRQVSIEGGPIDMFSQTVGGVVSPKDFINHDITILNFLLDP